MCCSITQLSVNFMSTSANAIGRSFPGHSCGICCPGSGFLGPQSSGESWTPSITSLCSAGPLPWSKYLSTRVTPLVPLQLFQQPLCQHFASHQILVRPSAQLPWPFVSPTSLLESVNLAAACLTAAHCIFSTQSRDRQYQQQPMCVPQQQFACSAARALVCRICRTARMLQESTLSLKHASCPPSVLCSVAGCACHHRVHPSHKTTNRARTCERALSTRLFLPVLHICMPTRCLLSAAFHASVLHHPHVRSPHRPVQAA